MATYRYVRWHVTKRSGFANSIQVSEFRLRNNGSPVTWNNSAVATNPDGTFPIAEPPSRVLDTNTATKWLDFGFFLSTPNAAVISNTVNGSSILVVDNAVNITFDEYEWFTANDFRERDPVSWTLQGSANGTDWILLDTRIDETITTTRFASAGTFAATDPTPLLRTIFKGIGRGIIR